MKKTFALVLALALLLSLFSGCSRMNTDKYPAAGDYVFSSFKAEGDTYDNNLSITSVLHLRADGTGTLETDKNESEEEEPVASEFTWSQMGNAITITTKDRTIDATLRGNTLTLEVDRVSLMFTKK